MSPVDKISAMLYLFALLNEGENLSCYYELIEIPFQDNLMTSLKQYRQGNNQSLTEVANWKHNLCPYLEGFFFKNIQFREGDEFSLKQSIITSFLEQVYVLFYSSPVPTKAYIITDEDYPVSTLTGETFMIVFENEKRIFALSLSWEKS